MTYTVFRSLQVFQFLFSPSWRTTSTGSDTCFDDTIWHPQDIFVSCSHLELCRAKLKQRITFCAWKSCVSFFFWISVEKWNIKAFWADLYKCSTLFWRDLHRIYSWSVKKKWHAPKKVIQKLILSIENKLVEGRDTTHSIRPTSTNRNLKRRIELSTE